MAETDAEFAKRIIRAASDIIGTLDPADFRGAINWGDLDCTGAEYVEQYDFRGEATCFWRIIVEEASPDAGDLQKVIQERLEQQGITDVYVMTEW